MWRGLATIDHLVSFISSAYAIFMRTQLLAHIPPSAEFNPFAEAEELDRGQGDAPVQQQHNKCVRRGFDSEAPDMEGCPSTGEPAQGMLETHLMSPYRKSPPAAPMDRGIHHGGRADRGAGLRRVIIEETEFSSDDSEEKRITIHP
ncbi:hypothetical protein JCGZ_05110 [Jatropha curcas]|uniref:Uncharacterized protein n=1 Tax=Jatropha curcas TaxID=180498 RepID=A0A067L3Y0_JATCU|nr:hypothetical protein JCGZ_05110 [Jatropha curcas]